MKKELLTPLYFEKTSGRNAGGCWVWAGSTQTAGYGQMRIDGRNFLAHRQAWEASFGEIPKGLYVCHICDVRACVNPAHLFLGNQTDNMRDCWAKGRAGMQIANFDHTRTNRKCKLTDADVIEIRASTWPLKHLADKFKVSMATISNVHRGLRKKLV